MDHARVLKVVLGFVALSHVLIGLGGYLSPGFQNQMAMIYGARVEWTGELVYVTRMLGAFMVGLGVAGFFAARDPLRYPGVVAGFAVVMLLRVAQRLFHMQEVQQLFAVPPARNVANAVFFAALGVGLLVLLTLASRQAGRGFGPATESA